MLPGMTQPQTFTAPGLDPCVAIMDDGALFNTLDEVMLGWRLEPAGDGTKPDIHIERGNLGWTCSGETYEKPLRFRDPVSTACSLIASLYKAHTLAGRDGLCLHAAGVRMGQGLVLLTGHYRAGKTVVATACAAAGLQVFSDDIIPMTADGRTAFAPGLAIRLRLPLPETLAPVTREFIERHRVASSERYAYIRPPSDRLARKGAEAPVTAIVSLNRNDAGPAMLTRIGGGDALSETIRRNFAREISAARILDALDGVIERAVCLRLDYTRAEEAVAILRQAADSRFAGLTETTETPQAADQERQCSPLALHKRISRVPGVVGRERDGQAFLTDAHEMVIFNLNETAAAFWRLIAEPASFGEVAALFAAGFPERSRDAIAVDLSHLARRLAQRGLVRID